MQQLAGAIGHGGLTGHRRYVTVLFCDLVESSRLAELLEAEEFAFLLERLRDRAREVVLAHGGVIARMQGDGMLALFGHMQAREDDGRRAAEAALELHRRIADLHAAGESLQLHSGIHGGLLLLLEGDIERGRFDVVGEVPNTAARLSQLAAPGEILVSTLTLGPQAHFFEIDSLRQVPIRGRSAPIDVVRVQSRTRIERRIDAAARRGVVPLCGRRAELHRLQESARRAAAGVASTVLLVGEPGIGKTRLLDEFVQGLEPSRFRVLRGYCEGYLGAVPLQPFMHWAREALGWSAVATPSDNRQRLLGMLAALAGERAAEFDSIVDALTDSREGAPSTVRVSVLVEFLALLAATRTLVLVLDDWQWADDASRHALETLRRRGLPVLILVASRPTTDDDHLLLGVEALTLQPLAPTDAEAAVSAWLPNGDPFIVQEVLRQSGGSPLFIEELCHAAAAGHELRGGGRYAGVAWLDTMVASRLARLPPAQADVLRKASVVGNTFSLGLLDGLVDADDVQALEAALASQDFIVPAGPAGLLRFRHGLTHAAVYGTVEPVQRRVMHLQVARLIEGAAELPDVYDRLEALSYHFDAAGEPVKAATYAEDAGDKALGAMALDRARAQYLTALRALDSRPALTRDDKLRWCGIAQKLGQTCVFDPLDVNQCFGRFDRAAKLARETGDENTVARAEYWLSYVNYGKGRPGAAIVHGETALALALSSQDHRLAAQVQATLAQALASAGRYPRAMPLFAAAVESKRQQGRPGSSAAIGLAYTLGRMGYTLGDLGRFEEARTHFEESLHLLAGKVHSVGASVRELICAVHLWQGRWQEASEWGRTGAELALECRSRYLTMMGRALGACGDWALRRDEASLQALAEATHWIQARGGAVSTSLNYGWLVEATLAHGLELQARRHAAWLFRRARALDRHGEAMGCRALALHAAAQRREDRAAYYLARADRAAQDRGSPREAAVNTLARGEVALRLGRAGEAREAALRSAEAFESMQMAWHRDQAQALLQRA